ncbi:MAG: AbrB/MazE/SpoVT family DNA-binding domain-containing protein [Proteobacteria bacterium]|nr:AbrB/MazE/SpoVT family DNA-binding domain-containing protein [Pseudomonadota bacterium]MCH9711675.1 AbrB/MazE/SpoVT family DNA-binding domain-containing protein [Pseudomonadota bacterium]MCH9749801.1 AbrB/MazE/SpoVT family DNA-binding domain-containing protein [Pseudomonadota bacterium]
MTISTVFLNNKTQAVRLPTEVRLDESIKKVFVRIKGKDRVISPVDSAWDGFFLSSKQVSDDFMSERPEQTECKRESFDD